MKYIIITIIMLLLAATAIAEPNCQKLAENKDNTVQNKVDSFITTTSINPCTNTKMTANVYRDYTHGFSRTVFENGDIKGTTGVSKYVSKYTLCTDGRAEVKTTVLQWIKGIAYGLWYNNPLVNYQNQYTIEQCNTF